MAGARRAAITDGVSALQLWSLSHRSGAVPRPKGCEGASFQPDGLSRCQSHPRHFSQQVMQRGRILSDGGFGSICKAEFRVKNPGSSHIPPTSLQSPSPGPQSWGICYLRIQRRWSEAKLLDVGEEGPFQDTAEFAAARRSQALLSLWAGHD